MKCAVEKKLANAFLPSKKVFLENSLDVLEMEI
jgi:hypothetical protein